MFISTPSVARHNCLVKKEKEVYKLQLDLVKKLENAALRYWRFEGSSSDLTMIGKSKKVRYKIIVNNFGLIRVIKHFSKTFATEYYLDLPSRLSSRVKRMYEKVLCQKQTAKERVLRDLQTLGE